MELASVGESMGMGAGAAAPTGSIGGLLGGLKMNPAKLGMMGMSLMQPQQQAMAPMGPHGMAPQQSSATTLFPRTGGVSLGGNVGGMPPELIGLPPNDPRVQEWMLKQRMMG
jgi:hypothetical protein